MAFNLLFISEILDMPFFEIDWTLLGFLNKMLFRVENPVNDMIADESSKNMTLEERLKRWMLESRKGDRRSYQLLLESIAHHLRRYFAKNFSGKSKETCEDLVQETLLAIHAKKSLYDESQPLLPWVYAIARYRMIDYFRSNARKSKNTIAVQDFSEMSSKEFESDTNPEREYFDAESQVRAFEDLLGELPERQRQMVILAKVEEVPLSEIAMRYNMKLSAVKVAIHRAIKSLRERAPQNADSD